jgi:hypothetical protein
VPGARVGVGISVGAAGVSVGSIPVGVGESVSTASVDVAGAAPGVLADWTCAVGDGVGLIKPAGPTPCGGDKVGLDVPTGLPGTVVGDGAVDATPPSDSSSVLAPGAFAGIGAAPAAGPGGAGGAGPRVVVRISHEVAVGNGVRVTQGVRGSWVGRMRAWSMTLRVKRAETTGISARFCSGAASGTITQVSASTSPIKMAHAATISVFNQKFLSR